MTRTPATDDAVKILRDRYSDLDHAIMTVERTMRACGLPVFDERRQQLRDEQQRLQAAQVFVYHAYEHLVGLTPPARWEAR
jgi:hypothetical protein